MTKVPAADRRILVVEDDRALRLAITSLLRAAGYPVAEAGSGGEALARLPTERVDVMLLDVGLPDMSGFDVLSRARAGAAPPLIVMMTADDTPETLLKAVRHQVHRFVRKPFTPSRIVEVVEEVLAASPAGSLPIEVVSASPEWLELVAPCSLEVSERIQEFVMQLDMALPEDMREAIGQAFREMVSNAIEWGGRLDPTRRVRISCLRGRRMLLYRIADPGEGFDASQLPHAAISNPDGDPLSHARVREDMGLRPGGLGMVMSRALVDEVIYNEKRNDVVLIKYLD